MNKEILGNSLEYLKTLEDESIDLILTDPPYNTTDCKWETKISWNDWWVEWKRIIKPTGTIVLTCQMPVLADIVSSGLDLYRHRWIWKKNKCANFMAAKASPMKYTEDILVFQKFGFMKSWNNNGKPKGIYNPQLIPASLASINRKKYKHEQSQSKNLQKIKNREKKVILSTLKNKPDNLKYPNDIIEFNVDTKDKIHPTQKPVLLFEYLIKTYTNDGMTVLDCFAGSMTTAISCLNTDRKYICIEQEEEMFNKAKERIKNWHDDKASRLF
tara:strand:+ start:77 stop:889 length:813 start_codon:yes stop_codon:yes gene_type:complete